MQYKLILPGGSAPQQLALATLAERSGWDGVFVWEAAYGMDAWSLLAAIATATTRIRIGTLLTPLPWRRPWKVASQAATVDQLSQGRVIVTVGLGALTSDLPLTGEVTDLRQRADLLDEGIDLIQRLWAGETRYGGRHYVYDGGPRSDLGEVVTPVQQLIPIWVVGVWPRPKSMARVLRCNGIVPQYEVGDRDAGPEAARALRAWLDPQVTPAFDVTAEGATPSHEQDAAIAEVSRWADAGCSWWLETR
jgi:alkanesulfonate monooxygenase SsuD/methylene tetrahydromethanopterin reductase-like flavin-dependent oxidoreductase (luciferase family)